MPIRKLIKITCTVILSLIIIILLFLGLRINSYKIFITSLVDGEKQIGLNKNMTGFATDFPYIYILMVILVLLLLTYYPMVQYVLFQIIKALVKHLYQLKMQI